MKEDINEVLGVQESNENETVTGYVDSYSHEKTLRTVATIILWVGIIATLICFITLCFPEKLQEGYHYKTEREFSVTGFLITVLTCISSVATWAILNVLSNISINLYKIKDALKQK